MPFSLSLLLGKPICNVFANDTERKSFLELIALDQPEVQPLTEPIQNDKDVFTDMKKSLIIQSRFAWHSTAWPSPTCEIEDLFIISLLIALDRRDCWRDNELRFMAPELQPLNQRLKIYS